MRHLPRPWKGGPEGKPGRTGGRPRSPLPGPTAATLTVPPLALGRALSSVGSAPVALAYFRCWINAFGVQAGKTLQADDTDPLIVAGVAQGILEPVDGPSVPAPRWNDVITRDELIVALDAQRAASVAAVLEAPEVAGTFAKRGAPSVAAPLLITTPVTITKTSTKAVAGHDSGTGLFYGTDLANGHYITSPDLVTWTDRTYSPSTYTPGMIAWAFDATYMYAYSTDGRIWRAAKGVFNAWTEITVSDKGPLTTGRPGSLCALGNGVLLYGNYTSGEGDGSHIWRSTNAGTNWTKVLTQPSGKHVHVIRQNPADGAVWASLGDQGHQGSGLWKSTDLGATWTHMSTNEYGIDMVFVPAREGRPALVVLEGDGLNRPHLVAFPQDGKPGDKTFPLVWFTGAPSDAASTRGTTRGICLTPNEDIIYWTTTEGGAVGTKAGLYVAQAPHYTRSVLLADTTGAEPVAYLRGFSAGNVAQNRTWTIPLPKFGTY